MMAWCPSAICRTGLLCLLFFWPPVESRAQRSDDRPATDASAEEPEMPEVRPAVVRPLRRRRVYSTQEINASPQTQAKVNSLISDVLLPEVSLDLDPNRSQLIRTKRPVSRFSITDPAIVEVVQFGPSEFELIGGEIGHTTVTLWFGEPGGDVQVLRYLVRVSRDEAVEDRQRIEYGELQDKVNEMFPNSVIQLIPISDKLIIRGQARDAKEASEILSVIADESIDQLGRFLGPGAQLDLGPAARSPGAEDLPASNLINLLEVPGEQQVMLKVRVAELTRSALRQMGADLTLNSGEFSFSAPLGVQGAFSAVLDSTEVGLVLQAAASNGYSKILAEPNLVTLNGQSASFISGGEFAVPTVVGIDGAAAATTQFRGFGTQLTFTPTIIDKDRIRLNVAPSFSTLNSDATVSGIPGLSTRAVFTTVDLREGQWLAVAGLLQDQQSGSKVRVPILGDVPGVDTIFSRREIKREETELLILVSPELIHPMEPEEVPLILPGMEVTEPADFDFYFHGRYEGDPDCHHRSTVWPIQRERIIDAKHDALREAKAQVPYQDSEKYYVHGPHGFSR